MARVIITRDDFLHDRQGRTFVDVLNDLEQPFDAVFGFFDDEGRQRRMEESEIHHDRPALAGVVRELESQPAIDDFLSSCHPTYCGTWGVPQHGWGIAQEATKDDGNCGSCTDALPCFQQSRKVHIPAR